MTEIIQADLIAASALIHLNIIQPKDEMVVAEYFAIHRKFGYGKGRMEERAAVIEFLRDNPEIYDWSPHTIAAAIIDEEHLSND